MAQAGSPVRMAYQRESRQESEAQAAAHTACCVSDTAPPITVQCLCAHASIHSFIHPSIQHVTQQDPLGPYQDRPFPHVLLFSSCLKSRDSSIYASPGLFFRCQNQHQMEDINHLMTMSMQSSELPALRIMLTVTSLAL